MFIFQSLPHDRLANRTQVYRFWLWCSTTCPCNRLIWDTNTVEITCVAAISTCTQTIIIAAAFYRKRSKQKQIAVIQNIVKVKNFVTINRLLETTLLLLPVWNNRSMLFLVKEPTLCILEINFLIKLLHYGGCWLKTAKSIGSIPSYACICASDRCVLCA